jgi:hypothetical protein
MTTPVELDHIGLGFNGGAILAQTAETEGDWVPQASHVVLVVSCLHLAVFFGDKVIQEGRGIPPLLDDHAVHLRHP